MWCRACTMWCSRSSKEIPSVAIPVWFDPVKLGRAVLLRTKGTDVGGGPGGQGYWTLLRPHKYEMEEKKSKFVVQACRVESPKEAMEQVSKLGNPGASHNCFAYKIGQKYRSSDDGEPTGTAGRPILAAIESENLDHVCVLVTRYFGGTKLGKGGLTRAYGGSARKCLQQADTVYIKPKVEIVLGFDSMGPIYQLLDKMGAERINEEYHEDGTLTITVNVEVELFEQLVQEAKKVSSGKVEIRRA